MVNASPATPLLSTTNPFNWNIPPKDIAPYQSSTVADFDVFAAAHSPFADIVNAASTIATIALYPITAYSFLHAVVYLFKLISTLVASISWVVGYAVYSARGVVVSTLEALSHFLGRLRDTLLASCCLLRACLLAWYHEGLQTVSNVWRCYGGWRFISFIHYSLTDYSHLSAARSRKVIGHCVTSTFQHGLKAAFTSVERFCYCIGRTTDLIFLQVVKVNQACVKTLSETFSALRTSKSHYRSQDAADHSDVV